MPRRTPLSSLRADDTWIDVTPLPDGSVAVASVSDTQVVVEQLAIDGAAMLLWSRSIAPGQFGYLRAAADAHGRVACIGQGQDGQAWLTRDGHAIESLGETFGVFCVEVQGLLEGWEVAILRAGGYELLLVPLEGAPVVTATVPTPTTQGFIQIDNGVVLQDDGRHAVPGLVLAERAGVYAAGQNPDAGPDRVRLTDDTGRFAALVEDSAQPPHVVEAHDGTLWVCSWLKSGAWFAGYQASDIPWGNDASPVPPEPPAQPPRVTIREFLPADGVAPLEVRAVAVIQAASGPVATLQWLARQAGAAEWTSVATNRAEDLDHTYTFDQAGRWELALRAFGPGGRDQTATPRIVTVSPAPVPPEPPMPEPGPDPSPRPGGDIVSMKCWDQTFVWCAEDGGGKEGDGRGRAVATRTEVNVWETFRSIVAEDGRVGFQSENGAWLSAQDDGTLWFNRAREPEFVPTAWEAFVVEPGLGGKGNCLKTDHGTYVQAIGGGGSGLIHADRKPQQSEAAETFFPSRPLLPSVGLPSSGEVYAGGLRQVGADCYADANGPALPVLCHYGDGLSKYLRDPGHVRANLDLMRSHGYGGVRTWGSLGGSYWAGREVGPAHQGEGYWQAVVAFCEELKARGMGWFLSQGDCYPQSIGNDPRGFFRRLGQTVRPYAPQICLFEVANESRDTTPGWDAGTCAQMAAEFQGACPEVTIRLLSAYTGHEDVAVTNDYSRDPATAFTVHGYRGGHWWDKVRHIFSFVYEQKPKRRLGWQGEPSGPGSRVSVTENQHELTDGPLMAMAAMSLMTRQGWVYFCGPGVISDEGETFAQMPGFACVPSVAAMLPKDVMQWTGGLFHGGDTWASQRMFKPEGETRCDHACSAAGAVVCLIYGPPPLRYTHVRGTIDVEHDLAGAAKLIIGHY